jgi:peptidyl-prolyl cis-trans isomerase C
MRFYLFLGLGLTLLACNRTAPPGVVQVDFRHATQGKGDPVATFGEDSVTTDELKRLFLEMTPMGRTRFQSVEQKREYVEGLARFELLAQEAVRRGLYSDPEVVHAAKQMLVQRLLRQELDDKPSPVSDKELNEFYEEHKADYVKPEMIRVSHIFLAAPKSEAAQVAAKKSKAEGLAQKAKALPAMDYAAFSQLVREHSDDETTKVRDGDLRFLSEADLAAQQGPEVAAAVKNLKQVGEVSGAVQTEKGFHILKLQGRQAALNLSLDDIKSQLQTRILYERRNASFAKLIDDLKVKSNYKVRDEVLAKVDVDLKAPTQEPKGPPPGFIPAPTPRAMVR